MLQAYPIELFEKNRYPMELVGGMNLYTWRWRHSNDFPNFRNISNYPTLDELKSKHDAYLPFTAFVLEPTLGKRDERNIHFYLDWLFRLLREDLMESVRTEIGLLVEDPESNKKVNTKLDNRFIASSVKVTKFRNITCNNHSGISIQVQFEQPPQITDKTLCMSSSTKSDILKKYWEDQTNLLQLGSAVIFVSGWKDFFATKDKSSIKLLGFGVITNRYISQLKKLYPTIGVGFTNIAESRQLFPEIGKDQDDIQLLQLSASFFAFVPVLQRLKFLSKVPFEQEILHDFASQPPQYFEAIRGIVETIGERDSNYDLKKLLSLKKTVVLDQSQKKAITQSLKNRLALIQGPPGTGKSLCGAIIAKILVEHTSERILCVCYTNHALDQYLEDLLDIGVPSRAIVRLGGSPKISNRVKPLTLASTKIKRLGASSSNCHSQLHQLKLLKESFNYHIKLLVQLNKSNDLTDFENVLGDGCLSAFEVRYENGKSWEALPRDYLSKRWIKGCTLGALKNQPQTASACHQIWAMSMRERNILIQKWRDEVTNPIMNILNSIMAHVKEINSQICSLHQEDEVATLRSKRIIGCTSTGAAINSKKLDNIDIGVLILEEAGEILEAHVVTSMPVNCKHLIMIGDHKQLRPKLDSYKLSVESGGPYKFNRSLFERLATKDFAHVRLQVQHRMRPEISDLVRNLTEVVSGHQTILYPDLLDAPKLFNAAVRPNIRGVRNNVIFIHHEEPEGLGSKMNVFEENLSKVNTHEAAMVKNIVRYLLKQNYQGNQITVLTPYSAQLQLLRHELSSDFDIEFNEFDKAELFRWGIHSNAKPDCIEPLSITPKKLEKPDKLLATIDSFQGEEADIVIGSLVRSNPEGDVGFVGQLERVNVLLSRARIGLVLIGNKKTFEDSKSTKARILWKKIFQQLKTNDAIYSFFPAYCEVHRKFMKLAKPEDFKNQVPEGGCDEICNKLMSCGKHICTKHCHPLPIDHDELECIVDVTQSCKNQHPVTLSCQSKRSPDDACKQCNR